jgi:hypothetical protein
MGDAMVERTGMGALKLDSACYLYAAWFALAEMASALGRPEAESYHLRAADWRERFERDWWIEDQHLYADSLHSDLRPQLDGHWTQVVPVQLGISSPEHARLVLDEIERSYVNEFGLVHTCGREARVWTLPTGLLALADLRWGRLDQAITQLHNIARTTRHGMLGSFEELIPEGLCFMQLWSAAIYIQGVVEGLLGLAPRAHEHCLGLWPHLPSNWPSATLRDLRIGDHRLMLEVSHTATTISHSQGPAPLRIEHVVGSSAIEAITVYGAPPTRASWERQGEHSAIFFTVEPGHTVTLRHGTGNKMVVEYADDQSDSSGREAATRINASRPDFQPGSDQSG